MCGASRCSAISSSAKSRPGRNYSLPLNSGVLEFRSQVTKSGRPDLVRERAATPALLRGVTAGHHLVGGAAREFHHMIEPRREAADAGSRRTDFHDEIADLR